DWVLLTLGKVLFVLMAPAAPISSIQYDTQQRLSCSVVYIKNRSYWLAWYAKPKYVSNGLRANTATLDKRMRKSLWRATPALQRNSGSACPMPFTWQIFL